MAELTITKDNFEEKVMQADKPVLLDFWASWCGPCQMLAPVIAELSEDYADKIYVGKVNVDEEAELAVQFGVTSIPTVVLMKEGEVASSSIGYASKEELIHTFQL